MVTATPVTTVPAGTEERLTLEVATVNAGAAFTLIVPVDVLAVPPAMLPPDAASICATLPAHIVSDDGEIVRAEGTAEIFTVVVAIFEQVPLL